MFKEVDEVKYALERANPKGSILELACGTGLWTQWLLTFAAQITAVDSSNEMIKLNKKRLNANCIRYHLANIFHWKPEEKYDFIFFSFWLSHVPIDRFETFWDSIGSYLNVSGRVFFIDSLYEPTSAAKDHHYPKKSQTTAKRRLNNNREYEIIKICYDPDKLREKLLALGWKIEVKKTEKFFLFGTGTLT